jgi:hypothetical protein
VCTNNNSEVNFKILKEIKSDLLLSSLPKQSTGVKQTIECY